MGALEASGKAENTLVVFVGDQGAPLTRGKTSCDEAGLKIPSLVRWPGRVTEGRVDSSLVSMVDILPTVLEAVQQDILSVIAGHRSCLASGAKRLIFGVITSLVSFYHTAETYFARYSVPDARYNLVLNLSDEPNPILSIVAILPTGWHSNQKVR